LSYTTFEYSDIAIDKKIMKDTETCTVTALVKNTGKFAGKEVVQLYVRNHGTGISRPIRELKGFEKLSLEPGEEKTVSFTLDKRAFAYFDVTIHDWFVETGDFEIEIGASSRDIRLNVPIIVEGTRKLPHVFNRYSSIGDVMSTSKGQAVLGGMMTAMQQQSNSTVNMGEGSGEMIAAMVKDMPLATVINFAGISDERLEEILTALTG
jgi:beta-glucosidase